jgi:hypothetical protein
MCLNQIFMNMILIITNIKCSKVHNSSTYINRIFILELRKFMKYVMYAWVSMIIFIFNFEIIWKSLYYFF